MVNHSVKSIAYLLVEHNSKFLLFVNALNTSLQGNYKL